MTLAPGPVNQLPGGKGVPSATNPTYSLSLPGSRRSAPPHFFIESFRIPAIPEPDLRAAGIEYQVLAGINNIETDYGRNLSVSSAHAVGRMQFLPSTWKEWDANGVGVGVGDPSNAVFVQSTGAVACSSTWTAHTCPRTPAPRCADPGGDTGYDVARDARELDGYASAEPLATGRLENSDGKVGMLAPHRDWRARERGRYPATFRYAAICGSTAEIGVQPWASTIVPLSGVTV